MAVEMPDLFGRVLQRTAGKWKPRMPVDSFLKTIERNSKLTQNEQ